MQRTIETLLAADLVAAGSITVSYPAGFSENHFAPVGHKIAVKNGGNLLQGDNFSVTLNANSAQITLGAGEGTMPAGTTLFVELRLKGNRDVIDPTVIGAAGNRISQRQVIEVNFGSPIVGDVDGICEAQAVAGAGVLTINGALASGGAVTLDVPRAVQIDSSNAGDTTQTVTITGTDEYGVAMVETLSANGTTDVLGTKAFKTITGVAASAAFAGNVTVGTTNKLGLPVFLPNSAYILKELEDGAAATAGTVVAGVIAKPTATTGDVRGTYTPNSTPNGAANFALLVALENPEYKGATQYSA